jgi:hypothetical protein
MFWGSKDIDDWQNSINSTLSELDVKAVLGFNESVLSYHVLSLLTSI